MPEVMRWTVNPAGGGGDDGEVEMEKLARFLLERLDLTSALDTMLSESQSALTPGAYLMLLVPVYEVQLYRNRESFKRYAQQVSSFGFGSTPDLLEGNREQTLQSIRKLIETARSSPAAADKQEPIMFSAFQPSTRTTLSIIKAFWANFCNIPPFCGETDS